MSSEKTSLGPAMDALLNATDPMPKLVKSDAKVVGKPVEKGFVTAPAAGLYQQPSWDGLSALSASMVSRVKQVLVVRKDLNMRKGKIAAQCAHASMKVLLDAMKSTRVQHFDASQPEVPTESYTDRTLQVVDGTPLQLWLDGAFAKICVSVNSEAELDAIYEKAKAAGLLCSLIVDSGRTEFHGQPTKTVVAIGPGFVDQVDTITGGLPLL